MVEIASYNGTKKAENYLRNAHDDLEVKVQEHTRELLEALQEKELLLREIHHRVKNNLQLISSLLNLQTLYIKDEEAIEFFKESQTRVKSIAILHEQLYQSKNLHKIDFGSYILNIVANLFQTYAVDQNMVKYNLNFDSIKLNIETSIPCGLIITELVTNSIKHAFPWIKLRPKPVNEPFASSTGEECKISVELHSKNENFTLTIRDNGIGFPEELDFKNTESLGLQLVILLVDQLGGIIELENREGTEFRIKFKELKYKERV